MYIYIHTHIHMYTHIYKHAHINTEMKPMPVKTYFTFLSLLVLLPKQVLLIDCYVCTSINGGNKACEDEFIPNYNTAKLIERECVYGLFRATHCTKLTGRREDGSTIVVRHCADADWGRHCGAIWYEKSEPGEHERMYGCLVACDKDGCNGSGRQQSFNLLLIASMSVAVALRVWLSV